MKKLLNVSFSKIYVVGVILISVLLVGGYFSYAMFTVSKEKSNAISIVTGNLDYELLIDGKVGDSLTIPENATMEFTITLNNPNNRIARFNFYYIENLPYGVSAGYIEQDGVNIPPSSIGINLEKVGSSSSSNIYKIKVTNATSSEITINLGVDVGLDYNDLSVPENGYLFEKYNVNLSDAVLTNAGSNGDYYDDGEDTFITGENPNNYIWYSGKLWRAVSVNNEEKTTKLVTQWNISTVIYSSDSANFSESYMEDWLNDTTVDGFLGNLREPDKFIVTDAEWNYSLDTRNLGSLTKPTDNNIAVDSVGLLNIYEYQMSYKGVTCNNGYLNNGLTWWTLTPYSASEIRIINNFGNSYNYSVSSRFDNIRPSVNIKRDVKVVEGDGTLNDPYRLEYDNDKDLSGVKLNTRYSGEYIKFGSGENNLYRIVSHETEGLTKITSAEPLKDSEMYKNMNFGNSVIFSNTISIGVFLNTDYLTNYVDDESSNMIEENSTWYLGTVGGGTSYKLAKFINLTGNITTTSTNAKVGLLRFGELMAGQFNSHENNIDYWTLTPYDSTHVHAVSIDGYGNYASPSQYSYAIKPALNLKSNVIIIGGDGTKNNPFTLKLQ